jgi:hypothetical protein
MNTRFRTTHAKARFICFDCQQWVDETMQMAWDNRRNQRICIPCFDKLSDILGEENREPKKQRVEWDSSMSKKPWEIGNYDINNWPLELQREYRELSSSKQIYDVELIRAQGRIAQGLDS